MLDIALHKRAHVPAREILGLAEIGPADAEISDQHRQCLTAVILAGQLAVTADRGHAQWPGAVGEHDHTRADLCACLDRILTRGDSINTAIKAVFRARPQLDARLL